MQRAGGRLYEMAMIGQHEYDTMVILKGVKPSVAKLIQTFLESLANSGSMLSRDFHASPSYGCIINPSCLSVRSLCHLMCIVVFLKRNKCFTLGVRACTEAVYVQPLSPPSPPSSFTSSMYLDLPHFKHFSSLPCSFQKIMQLS
jgi:hypothetical protein